MTVPTETRPPVPGCLVTTNEPSGVHLGERKADPHPTLDLLEEGVIPPRRLRSALEHANGRTGKIDACMPGPSGTT